MEDIDPFEFFAALEEEEQGDSSSSGGIETPPGYRPVFPFEHSTHRLPEDALFTNNFWYDGSYGKVDWLGDTVKWGKWLYDPKTRTIKHSLTHRAISLGKLNSPQRLLRTMTSLMTQPHGDPSHFYQLATGILQKRHQKDWKDLWTKGEEIIKEDKKDNTPSSGKSL